MCGTGCKGGETTVMTKNCFEPTKEEEYASMCIPYWYGDTIENETLMCLDDGNRIGGFLQYDPVEILSVKSYDLEREFREKRHFIMDGNRFLIPASSPVPFLKESAPRGIDVPPPYKSVSEIKNIETDYVRLSPEVIWTEGTLFYGHQVCVTYRYRREQVKSDLFGEYGQAAPEFCRKTASGENVTVAIIGDSVAEGCSSSGKFSHKPFQPDFFRLFASAVRTYCRIRVDAFNYAVGGTGSKWGAEEKQIDACAEEKPDVLFVHFGINDNGAMSAEEFGSNIRALAEGVWKKAPGCEIVFLKAAMTNPRSASEKNYRAFWAQADALAEEYEKFYTVDMFEWSLELLRKKRYEDISGNGVNHLNDYTTRLYAMTLVNAFIPKQKILENADETVCEG